MSLKVGQSITLGDGRQGIIKYISPRKELVNEYATGDSFPVAVYEYQEIVVILQNGLRVTTRIRTGSRYCNRISNWVGCY